MSKEIRLCLTLYALSAEYVNGALTLEGCLKKAHEMGYTGIELVASQMIPEYPYPSQRWMDSFVAQLKKYQLHPVCYSSYIDMGTHFDRDLTEEEIMQSTLNDMVYAKYMGFDLVRTQHAISPSIYEKMLAHARKIGIILAIEMHHPHNPELPLWKEYLSIMERNADCAGVVPDFSIFAETPHAFHIRQAVEDFGCREEKIAEIISAHKGSTEQDLVQAGDYNDGERNFIREVFETYGYGKARLDWLEILLPRTVYIHGKFWYLGRDAIDHTIPYEMLLPIIKTSGYKGYIASEYEGHHFSMTEDTETQLKRWVAMTKRILNATE